MLNLFDIMSWSSSNPPDRPPDEGETVLAFSRRDQIYRVTNYIAEEETTVASSPSIKIIFWDSSQCKMRQPFEC